MLFLLCLLLAEPFWSAKPASQWTDEEIAGLLADSPWARMVPGPARMPAVQMFLATAAPIRQAELEAKRRASRQQPPDASTEDPFAEEYRAWLEENKSSQLILAIRIHDTEPYQNAKQLERLEKDSVMRVGRNRIPMTGYFPPTPADPFLRIAFPREVSPQDKELRFELYVPGITGPFREVEFRLADMLVDGQPEL
jgi:hypothetical protein